MNHLKTNLLKRFSITLATILLTIHISYSQQECYTNDDLTPDVGDASADVFGLILPGRGDKGSHVPRINNYQKNRANNFISRTSRYRYFENLISKDCLLYFPFIESFSQINQEPDISDFALRGWRFAHLSLHWPG